MREPLSYFTEVTPHILNKEKFSVSLAVAPEFSTYKIGHDLVRETLVHQMDQYIWSLPQDRIEVKVPSSWWQHFKRDMMPKWFTDRYPVKDKLWVVINRKLLYPNFHGNDDPRIFTQVVYTCDMELPKY